MFSGIQSFLFGKKHHHKGHLQTHDDSALDSSSVGEGDFTIIGRRHSDEMDVTPGLYPHVDPLVPSAGGILPYGVSPSLPDLRPQNNTKNALNKGQIADNLHGVPFELASYVNIMTEEKDQTFTELLHRLQRFQEQVSEDDINGYTYDFDLENRIMREFQT